MAIYNNIDSLRIGGNTYNLKNTTYGVFGSSNGLVPANTNRNSWDVLGINGWMNVPFANSTYPGGIKIGFTQNGKNYPVQLDANDGKAYVNVPWSDTITSYEEGSKSDLINATSASTTNKVWSAHVLNDWMSDILGVDLEKTTANMTALEKLFENGNVSDGIISELNKKLEGAATTNTLGGVKIFGTTTSAIADGTNKNYGVRLDKDNKAYVNVPWPQYTLPVASTGNIGGVKVGAVLPTSTTSVDIINQIDHSNVDTNVANRYYGLQTMDDGKAFVNVPWTNTTYGTATGTSNGLMSQNDKVKLDGIGSNTGVVSEPFTSTSGGPTTNATPSHGGTFTVPQVAQDVHGQVTVTNRTITLPGNYSLPTATTNALGGIKVSNALSSTVTLTSTNGATASRYYGVQRDSNGVAFVNVPWTDSNNTYTLSATVDGNTLVITI